MDPKNLVKMLRTELGELIRVHNWRIHCLCDGFVGRIICVLLRQFELKGMVELKEAELARISTKYADQANDIDKWTKAVVLDLKRSKLPSGEARTEMMARATSILERLRENSEEQRALSKELEELDKGSDGETKDAKETRQKRANDIREQIRILNERGKVEGPIVSMIDIENGSAHGRWQEEYGEHEQPDNAVGNLSRAMRKIESGDNPI